MSWDCFGSACDPGTMERTANLYLPQEGQEEQSHLDVGWPLRVRLDLDHI